MASTSRSALRVARTAIRAPAPSPNLIAVRRYATEVRDASSSAAESRTDSLESLYVAPSSIRKDDGGAIMKRYTGPGFPKIPGLRHLVLPYHPHLHRGGPVRDLTIAKRNNGGRNDTGRLVNRGRGGGHKKRLRIVDFYRLEAGEHDVIRIEYDPGRSAHIALVKARGALTQGQTPADVDVETGAELAELELSAEEEKALEASTAGQSKVERRAVRNEVKGGWSYILASEGLRAGDVVVSYRNGIPSGIVEGWDDITKNLSAAASASAAAGASDPADPAAPQSVVPPEESTSRALGLLRTFTLKPGNVLPLYLLPVGTNIHNISLKPDGRMQLCRAAGSYAQIVAHHGPTGEALGGAETLQMGGVLGPDGKITRKNGTVLVKLQSGEVRRLDPGCAATVGTASNKEHHSTSIGKAGRNRWLGKRPTVRGVAMNACDHPHGGGRGKSKGNQHPRSVYGWLTRGKRTRRSKDKDGNKAVVTERPRGRASAKK